MRCLADRSKVYETNSYLKNGLDTLIRQSLCRHRERNALSDYSNVLAEHWL